MSAGLVIYLHWMIAWFFFAKSQCLSHQPNQDTALQNRTVTALEQCRSHLMQAYTQEAHFSQTHIHKRRKSQAIIHCQIALADINRLLACCVVETRFQADHIVQADPYGAYVKFSRAVLETTKKFGYSRQELWLQQAVFELTKNTALFFPDETEISQRAGEFYERHKGLEYSANQYSVQSTSNRLFYGLSEARQFFMESQQTEDKCRMEKNVGTYFIMPKIKIDDEVYFSEMVSQFRKSAGDNECVFLHNSGDELLLKAHVLGSDWLEVCGWVWKAMYHMGAADKEVTQAWCAERTFEKSIQILEKCIFPEIEKAELQRFTVQLIALQAKAALHTSRQAQSLYTGFEDQKILSKEDKSEISKEWKKKAAALKKTIKKSSGSVGSKTKRPLMMVILDEWISEG